MRIFVEIEPETTYIGRVEDEVKTVEARMWFETDEDVEVLSLTDYTKQVRKEVVQELKNKIKKELIIFYTEEDRKTFNKVLKQIQGETDGK